MELVAPVSIGLQPLFTIKIGRFCGLHGPESVPPGCLNRSKPIFKHQIDH